MVIYYLQLLVYFYTLDTRDVEVDEKDNKRFTMRDINDFRK